MGNEGKVVRCLVSRRGNSSAMACVNLDRDPPEPLPPNIQFGLLQEAGAELISELRSSLPAQLTMTDQISGTTSTLFSDTVQLSQPDSGPASFSTLSYPALLGSWHVVASTLPLWKDKQVSLFGSV